MSFIPTPTCAQIQLVYNWQQQICVNTLYYAGNNATDPDVLMALAEDAFLMWNAATKPLQNTSCALTMIRATDMSNETGPSVEFVTSPPNTGTLSGENLPANCAAVVSLRTAGRGRASRGRIYIPGLNTQQVTNSIWHDSVRDSGPSFFENFQFLDANGEPFGLQVLSRQFNGVPRTAGLLRQVTSVIVNPHVASQRRRLPGRGT